MITKGWGRSLRSFAIGVVTLALTATNAAFVPLGASTANAAVLRDNAVAMQAISANVSEYSQCANDTGTGYTTGDTGCRWTNGDLNHTNSAIFEGDATVQRLFIEQLTNGSHTVVIEYQTTKGGKHAYDFIADDLFSETWVTAADLCQAPVATTFPACAGLTPNVSGLIPADPMALGHDTATSARHFKIRNGTITNVGAPTLVNGTYAGDSLTDITVTFSVDTSTCANKTTVSGTDTCPVLLTFGGHVSREIDWGIGSAAVNISGSPYHVKVVQMDGSSTGNRDNQMAASAILIATLTLQKVVVNAHGGTAVATDWTLTATGPQTFSGAMGSAPVTAAEVAPGTYTLSEAGPSGYSASQWSCVKNGGAPVLGSSITLANLDTATCTITNSDQGPQLTLAKHVVNTHGGTANASAWTLTATGSGGFSGTGSPATGADASITHSVTANVQYTLSESGGPAGYTAASAWVCTGGTFVSPDKITVGLAQSATCTMTNSDTAAHLTLVKTVSNTHGGTAAPSNFTLSASGPTPISGAGGADSNVSAGTYTLSETSLAGYAAGSWSCVKNGGAPVLGSSITLGLGDTATCTINNSDIGPSLTLIKTVTNNFGGTATPTAWTLTATGASGSPTNLSGTTPVASGAGFKADTYALAETGGPSGYAASAWSCVKNGGAPVLGSSITLGLADTATCTINNSDIAPVLTIAKHVINDNGGTANAGDWMLSAQSTLFGFAGNGLPALGPDASITQGVVAGQYTLTESGGPAGYTASAAWVCTGGGTFTAPNKITLAVGQTATCTITNNDQPAHLTLVKTVTNVNGGTAKTTDFMLSASGPTPISGLGGTSSDVNAGSYTLSETGPAGYTASAWSCVKNGGAPVLGSSVTLGSGDSATCSITNTDSAAHLTLVKVVSNTHGGTATTSAFTLSANGPTPISGAGGVSSNVNAGTYTLSETGPAGYAASAWSCVKNEGAPVSGSSITLGLADSATCTITNSDIAPTLTLAKHVINDNGGTQNASAWTLTATGSGGFSGTGSPASGTDASLTRDVTANVQYALSESGPAGYTAGAAWACTGAGTFVTPNKITLGVGQTATCTITNDDNPPAPTPTPSPTLPPPPPAPQTGSLVVIKYNDLNGNGTRDANEPTLSSVTFTVSTGGVQIGSITTDSSGSATRSGLATGQYTVVESVPAGWVSTDPGGSAPTKSASVIAGQTTTLVFGNRQITLPPTTVGATITVTKYEDANRNGRRDSGENALGGWQFTIRDQQGAIAATITTGANGSASASNLAPGTYVITETTQTGWTSTDPGGASPFKTITVAAGDSVSIAFGNAKIQLPSTSTVSDNTSTTLVRVTLVLIFLALSFQVWEARRARRAIPTRTMDDEEGQGLVEYALIIAIIAIAVIVAMIFLRDQITNVFSNIGNNLT